MVSTRSKATKNGSHSNQNRANRFFKIVLDPEDHRLKLPKSFIKRWGQNLPDEVTLKAPNGTIRKVNLVQHAGETWLHKGLEEFNEYYSIGFGHMLMFEYDENSHFDVLIFDTTTSEIEYPVDNGNGPVEIITHRAGKMPIKVEYESESESDDSPAILRDFRSKFKGKSEIILPKQEKCTEVKGKLSKPKRVGSFIAYQRAAAFKSISPFFVKRMHRTNVTLPSVIEIPTTFLREHLCENKNALELKIWVHEEKTWDVRCCIGKNRATLTTGWKKFVKDNALKLGDACVFEMDNIDMSLWKVTIFPC